MQEAIHKLIQFVNEITYQKKKITNVTNVIVYILAG